MTLPEVLRRALNEPTLCQALYENVIEANSNLNLGLEPADLDYLSAVFTRSMADYPDKQVRDLVLFLSQFTAVPSAGEPVTEPGPFWIM